MTTNQTLIPVYLGTYNPSYHVADVALDEIKDPQDAEPTSRVLEGSGDDGYAQEWAERCTLRGHDATLIYLFDDGDLVDPRTGEEIEDAQDLPWESAAARIIVEDWDEGGEPTPQERVGVVGSLDELRDVLNELGDELEFVDTSSLPTFGGDEPSDTQEIFSWDADRFLVVSDQWRLIPRQEATWLPEYSDSDD